MRSKFVVSVKIQYFISVRRRFAEDKFALVKLLLEQCYIDSAGSVATSLWEKSICLQFILTNLQLYIRQDWPAHAGE